MCSGYLSVHVLSGSVTSFEYLCMLEECVFSVVGHQIDVLCKFINYINILDVYQSSCKRLKESLYSVC